MIKGLTPITYNNKSYYYRTEVMAMKDMCSLKNFNSYRDKCKGEFIAIPKKDRYSVLQQLNAANLLVKPAARIVLVDQEYALAYLTKGRNKQKVEMIEDVEETSISRPQIVPFEFEEFPVNVYLRDGEYYFVAREVCKILDIKNPWDALTRLDSDEKLLLEGKSNLLGLAEEALDPNTVQLNLVTYPGLLRLALTSKKPNARAFQRWVLHDVLDSIQKKGYYARPGITPTFNQPKDLRELYESNSCLLLKDQTYHDFLQRMIMKIVGQIPHFHWEEEISVTNTYNPEEAQTRRFDLVEIQAGDRIIIWEVHTQPIDREKVTCTILDKAYLKLAREYYKGKKVYLTFTSPEGITKDGELAIQEFRDARFVDYRDLILHLFRLFRKLTPSKSQWRLQKEEEQLRAIIGDRPDIPLDLSNSFKGVTRFKDDSKFKVSCCIRSKRIHVASCSCPIEAALIYDQYIKENKLDKALNFPQLSYNEIQELLTPTSLLAPVNTALQTSHSIK